MLCGGPFKTFFAKDVHEKRTVLQSIRLASLNLRPFKIFLSKPYRCKHGKQCYFDLPASAKSCCLLWMFFLYWRNSLSNIRWDKIGKRGGYKKAEAARRSLSRLLLIDSFNPFWRSHSVSSWNTHDLAGVLSLFGTCAWTRATWRERERANADRWRRVRRGGRWKVHKLKE